MRNLYEMQLSDAQWWAYDIPGNIGWIVWIAGTVLCWMDGVTPFSILAVLPALLMLVGVIELISERIAGLGPVLPKARVLRGFGALTAGGVLGIPVAFYGWISKAAGNRSVWMLAGAVLCALFAGLCWKGYKRKEE